MPNAVALNATFLNTGRVVGPALGGLLIATYGIGWYFVLNAASFIVVITALLLIRSSELYGRDRTGETQSSALAVIGEALAYLRSSVELQLIMVMGAVFGLFGFSALRTLCRCLHRQRCTGRGDLRGALRRLRRRCAHRRTPIATR